MHKIIHLCKKNMCCGAEILCQFISSRVPNAILSRYKVFPTKMHQDLEPNSLAGQLGCLIGKAAISS